MRRHALLAALNLLVWAPATVAQPETDPQLTDPSWRDIRPADAAIPGAAPEAADRALDFRVRRPPLLPEGSFLPKRRGVMVRSGSGEWVYVFYPDARGDAESPMTLLPSATLERMEEVTQRRQQRPEFILTGQVFVYNGANYLLPTAFSVAPPPAPPEPEETGEHVGGADDAQAGAEPPVETGDRSPLDDAVEALVRRIEAERPGERALGEASLLGEAGDPAQGATPGGAEPRPDGELLVRRRARLIRLAGAWRLAIDNDPDGPTPPTTMMVVLPCLNLERMERLAADLGENQTFEVSGMVTQYRRRNYILPTIYRITRPGDVSPLQ
ncbi:MAG: hypothetical protein ACF8R7_03790 [Phycisphaerales bacterium JB039]